MWPIKEKENISCLYIVDKSYAVGMIRYGSLINIDPSWLCIFGHLFPLNFSVCITKFFFCSIPDKKHFLTMNCIIYKAAEEVSQFLHFRNGGKFCKFFSEIN